MILLLLIVLLNINNSNSVGYHMILLLLGTGCLVHTLRMRCRYDVFIVNSEMCVCSSHATVYHATEYRVRVLLSKYVLMYCCVLFCSTVLGSKYVVVCTYDV